MIYLASPYSHEDPAVMEERYQQALEVSSQMLSAGNVVFSPVVYGHHFAIQHGHGVDFNTWEMFNITMLRHAAGMAILKLPGWKESKGIAAEFSLAISLYIPVVHLAYPYHG